MTDFLLIRHGETDWNRELRFQGRIDIPLNDIGQLQAQRLKKRFAQTLAQWRADKREIHGVVSSVLQRAHQTAQPIAELLDVESVLESGLQEQCYGIFEGLTAQEIKLQYPDAWTQWLAFDSQVAVEGAESAQVFHDRVMQVMDGLAMQYEDGHVVVVTHGGVLDMVWRHAQQHTLDGRRVCDIPNAGINHVSFKDGRWQVESWADTEHLADLPPQPVYHQTQLKA
jgi:probable phosphoglycerate mutase